MRILMVCLGNICRSPLAEGIMKEKIKRHGLNWTVDSAGTAGYHDGKLPDQRSIDIAQKNGIEIRDQRSRQFVQSDFDGFDLILVMDSSNYQNICSIARNEEDRQLVKLILNFTYSGENRAVPDPYYNNGFSEVYEMLNMSCDDIIQAYAS
ncbi:MAG: low molecular weight protein-tyrosine-phosphatase [Saprospiraceae bacterium]